MGKVGKRTKKAMEAFNGKSNVSIEEAVKLVKSNATAKFDETIEIAMNLGVDTRHADQMVRGVVGLPNGTGKSMRVAVFARDAKAQEAKAAGADALAQTPEIGNWLGSLFPGKKIFIYSLIYLDGEKYVRASMAMDVIVDMATSIRGADKVGLLYIATPSAAHVVDAKCERRAKIFYKNVPFWQKIFEMVGLLKRQKFLTLQSHTDHRVVDCLASMQGPNYALAKFLQTCRVLIARIKYGQFVSVNVAPPALTASVMHAPKIAAAAPYIPLFKPNVMYYPDTASSILSLLLLADIRNKKSNSYASTKLAHPLLLIADQAWHGGCFNAPYSSESTGVASYISYLLYKTMPWMVVILVAVMLYFTSGRFF